MRILHVLSAEFFAGSVAYAVQLAEAHRQQGHAVWLACDATELPTGATLITLPISNRRYGQRWRNIRRLRQLIQTEQIDVVHCHSRAASWVSYFAVRGLLVPLVSTVHGRQHLHTSTSLFDIYGDKVIAICANLKEHLVDEVKMDAAKIALVPNGVDFSPLPLFVGANTENDQCNSVLAITNTSLVTADKPSVITKEELAVTNNVLATTDNPFAIADRELAITDKPSATTDTLLPLADRSFAITDKSSAMGDKELAIADSSSAIAASATELPRIAFIGRFNGGKGERAAALLQQVFPALLTEVPGLRLALIGGELEHLPAAGKAALAALQIQFGERIEVVGFTKDVAGWLARTTLVVGAGRVAIEALGAGRAVLALGEANYAGLVATGNFAEAAASNFGDISAHVASSEVDFGQVLADARAYLQQPQPVPAALVAQVRAHYDLAGVAAAVLEVYQSARMRRVAPDYIPVLMYHKIPDAPLATKHQIYVTKDKFAKHLSFFKWRGFTPLTFVDYLQFARAERPLRDFPVRPLVLTFDDGYTDNYTNLLPLMQRYGYRGVLYLLGDFDIRYNYWDADTDPTEPRSDIMDRTQKQAFVAAGWEIGAHTMSHAHLPQLSPEAAFAEIQTSKTVLEAALQTKIETFAYPFGDINEDVKAAVRAAGFALGVATDTGGLHLEDDRMQVFRINMFPNESTTSLLKKTASWYRGYYRRKRGK